MTERARRSAEDALLTAPAAGDWVAVLFPWERRIIQLTRIGVRRHNFCELSFWNLPWPTQARPHPDNTPGPIDGTSAWRNRWHGGLASARLARERRRAPPSNLEADENATSFPERVKRGLGVVSLNMAWLPHDILPRVAPNRATDTNKPCAAPGIATDQHGRDHMFMGRPRSALAGSGPSEAGGDLWRCPSPTQRDDRRPHC